MTRNASFSRFLSIALTTGLILAGSLFQSLEAQTVFTIEGENFNFDGGQFIDAPSPGDFEGKGADLGVPGVDFRENAPANRPADEYRRPAASGPGLPQTAPSGDTERTAGITEYDLASVEAGEWVNYTRTFPAGDYQVMARVRPDPDGEPFIARLEKVTGDSTQEGQTATAQGVLLGRNADAGYSLLSMSDVNENPVTISLDGEATLRVAVQAGRFDLNYLQFVSTDTPAPMPTIDIVAPTRWTGVAPGSELEIMMEVPDPAAVTAVQLLANSLDGGETTIAELAGPPFVATWSNIPEGTHRLLAVVAATNGLIGLSSEIPVIADDTLPELQQARGRTIEEIVLTFSEAMKLSTAADPSNYTIENAEGTPLEVLGARVAIDGRVLLATAEQTVGETYTITINNLTDLAGNALPADTTASFIGNGPLVQTELGFVVFEAEHFDRNLDGLWVEDPDHGTPSGGVSMLVPNGAGGSEDETKLEYDIKFVKTGTHYFWYRASADNSGSDDSAWLHLDGQRPAERADANRASMVGFNGQLEFVWRSNAQDGGGMMSFEVDSLGVHSIGIALREDGVRFDKFVIMTDPNFDPSELGEFGPPLTPREGEGVSSGEVEITLHPMDVAGDEHSTIVLQADGTGTEGFIIVFQWQRLIDGEWIDIPDATLPVLTIDRANLDWDGAVVRMAVSTEGASAVSSEATITVNPETEPPGLIGATGRGQRISLLFSERLESAGAQDLANYMVASDAGPLAIQEVQLLASERAVNLATDPQTIGTKYTVTVSGIMDQAAVPNVVSESSVKFYSLGDLLPQGEDGLLVVEAENYTDNSDGLWIEDTAWGIPSGGVSMVLPNDAGGNEDSKLEYELTFTQTGEHILWYRASGPSGSDDSAYLHLDGTRPPNRVDGNLASMAGFGETQDFVWASNPQEGPSPMTFEIEAPGVYRLGLALREDGAYFDKFVITTDPDFDPADFGPFGPPESRDGAPPLPNLTISLPAVVEEGADVVITPDISPTNRVITRVEYFAEGEKIGESAVSPFSFTWSGAPAGVHTITASLIDDVGDVVMSSGVDVTVEGDPGPIGPMVPGDGKSVIWISQVASDAGDGFKQLLETSNFQLTEMFIMDPTPEEQAILNAADVVVISRKTSSGDYNNETWDTAITAPLLLMTPYLSRANHWGWLEGDGLTDDTPAEILANVPAHAVFNDITLENDLSAAWHTAVDRGTSLASEPIANGGTVIASSGSNLVVAEWPANTVAVGPRMLFSAGSREADGSGIETSGKFNLTETGALAFLNAVLHMASLDDEPPAEVPEWLSITRTPQAIRIEMVAGVTYDVEYSPTLAPGSWEVIASDVSESFEDTDSTRIDAERGFYRGVSR